MSETPITARVDTLEQQLAQITNVQAQNANAIIALVNAIDRLCTDIDDRFIASDVRLAVMEKQLTALNESNRLLAELITTRLPPPSNE
jgi:hypothetical protein